ncbi:MAG: hypothetical protein IJ449_07325 [Clostridia bacterium]|nr:hypothetical protein [Clostridia bacterium]
MKDRRIRYIPTRHPGTACLLSVSLFAAGLIVRAMMRPLAPSVAVMLLMLTAYALLIMSIVFLWRFGLVSYEYYAVDGIFYVSRVLFGHRRVVCDLALAHIRYIVNSGGASDKNDVPPGIRAVRSYNYTVSWPLDSAVRIYYGTNPERLSVMVLNDNTRGFYDALRVMVEEEHALLPKE